MMRIGRISRLLSPGYGWCLRCGTTWKFVTPHNTQYTPHRGCFPLCEKCWAGLIPATRLPYYEQLWLSWFVGDVSAMDSKRLDELEAEWPLIERAVLGEDARRG